MFFLLITIQVAVEVLFQRPDDTEVRPEILQKMNKIIKDTENLVNTEFIASSKKNRIIAYCKNLEDLQQDLMQEFRICNDVSLIFNCLFGVDCD